MKLTCRRNKLEFQFNPRQLKFAQSEEPPIDLPLTVGQKYELQIISRLDKGSWGGAFDWNALQGEKLCMIIFTDNKVWEEIEIPQKFVPLDLRGLSELNQQIKSIFEDPS